MTRGGGLRAELRGARTLVVMLWIATWLGPFSSFAAAEPPEGAPPDTTASKPRSASVRDSPGWYPSRDPESTSVVIGRRTNAPLVRKPFHGGAHSLDDLGRRVCRFMHHSSRDSLMGLCIRADEFRDILWREFPQSRPATGLKWEDAWNIVGMRLMTGCAGAIQENGGRYLEFLRFERADSVMRFKNFQVHRGLTLVARNDEGQEERMTWLRSVAERKGIFKIFAVKD
jgi:hypothetical protein